MTKMVWLCDICKTQHSTESDAGICECSHLGLDKFKITQVWYKKRDGLYGPARLNAAVVPESLRVEGPRNFHATYKLDYEGFKGV